MGGGARRKGWGAAARRVCGARGRYGSGWPWQVAEDNVDKTKALGKEEIAELLEQQLSAQESRDAPEMYARDARARRTREMQPRCNVRRRSSGTTPTSRRTRRRRSSSQRRLPTISRSASSSCSQSSSRRGRTYLSCRVSCAAVQPRPFGCSILLSAHRRRARTTRLRSRSSSLTRSALSRSASARGPIS